MQPQRVLAPGLQPCEREGESALGFIQDMQFDRVGIRMCSQLCLAEALLAPRDLPLVLVAEPNLNAHAIFAAFPDTPQRRGINLCRLQFLCMSARVPLWKEELPLL